MPGGRAPRAQPAPADADDADAATDHYSERESSSPTGTTGQAGPGAAAGPGPARPKEEARRGGGWIGSLFSKLRPPNQMNLPDDKNPTIVWDAEHKRWRDLASDAPPAAAAPPPPPQVTSTSLQSPGPGPGAPATNMFKMPSRRNIKQSYVDVFNPGGSRAAPVAGPGLAPGPGPAPAPAPAAPPLGYFVPSAAHYDQETDADAPSGT